MLREYFGNEGGSNNSMLEIETGPSRSLLSGSLRSAFSCGAVECRYLGRLSTQQTQDTLYDHRRGKEHHLVVAIHDRCLGTALRMRALPP